GATHAAVGVHTAKQDSTPLILFIGQIAREMRDREAFQEVDFRAMFAPLAKWAAEIDDAKRIPEYVARAFAVATSGRPGPVVLSLPEDMLIDEVDVEDAQPYQPVQASPHPSDMEKLRGMLAAAKQPLMILGGGTWTLAATKDIVAFAEANDLATGVAFRCQDYVDNRHPCYVGDIGVGVNPKLAERVKNADLLIAVGTRLEETVTSGYTLLEVPRPKQKLIHIHPDAGELGRVYQADLPIVAGMPQFAAAARALKPIDKPTWRGWTESARADYQAALELPKVPGALDMGVVVKHLRDTLPDDAIITNGAGNYAVWVHRFHQYKSFKSQLAPTSGAMGYGVPAAVAAKLVHPERTVVSFNGDGCFLMCGQELATAKQYGVAPIFIVVNNGMYGTIRMHQEREYPTHVWGTDIQNPDFAALAKAYGAHGELVERTEDFVPAFERARAAGKAALIELRLDPEALTPRASLSQIRAAALAKQGS
ncbi:MAG: thiamine pyrophosphate-binding protein, partial [Alphaproteobacteria bacterium]|nr:thiamine pyrophosphate-binding protein [Alphaproteobacteria bacterium]